MGENLALGNFADETEIMAAWMASPGHKANIINPRYRELGVAVSTGQFKSERATIAVQIFGEPQTVCAVPNPETKAEIDSSTVVIKKMQTEAIALYGNLTQLKNTPNLDQSYYNQKVQEYNYFARTTNEAVVAMKTMIDFYNSQVAKYNTCLKQ